MATFRNAIFIFFLLVGITGRVFAQNVDVKIARSNVLLSAPLIIAEHNGYFAETGLRVSVKETSSGKAALEQMLILENVDIVLVAQTPIVFNSFANQKFVIIAGITNSYKDLKILARNDRNIATFSDLKGRRVGVTKGTSGEAFLGLCLAQNIMFSSDITIIDFSPQELASALAKGTVDAIASWEPVIVRAKELLKDKFIDIPTRGIYREDFFIVSRRDFARRSPQDLRKFLIAVQKAMDFIKNNREEAIRIVAEKVDLDKILVNAIWDEFEYGLFLDQAILVNLEDEARWLLRENGNVSKETPNYLNFIDLAPLEEIKPEAVTIFR